MEATINTEAVFSRKIEAGKLGIWLFILSEIMLFGGFLASYVMLRLGSSVCALGTPAWPQAGYTGGLLLATLNTLVLITSSFTMVKAYVASRQKNASGFSLNLSVTILLGCLFLLIKAFEYTSKYYHGYFPGTEFMTANPGLGIFISFYYGLTGLHALHVIVGVLWNFFLLRFGTSQGFRETFVRKVEYAGLYWHFVDIVWVLLYPLFYLV
ncbi:MAG: heme-copper oxidase subunit III [Elusimicrobia bacterium]|nr:heme-copper oxidase subunit III [Elusimicrobiota bacterium]